MSRRTLNKQSRAYLLGGEEAARKAGQYCRKQWKRGHATWRREFFKTRVQALLAKETAS